MMHISRTYFPGRFLSGATLLVICFLYFAIFNRYHILSLEQSQLFIYSPDFFRESFSVPGGLPVFLGSFFTQFFISPWAGALIISLAACAAFTVALYILRRHNSGSITAALIPVWILTILQSNELFTFNQFTGFLLLLLFFAMYISIDRSRLRYLAGLAGWPVFYFLTGGFAIPCIVMCMAHELFFRKQNHYGLIALLYFIEGILIPFICGYLVFYVTPGKAYIYPVIQELHSMPLYLMILILIWIPAILTARHFLPGFSFQPEAKERGKIARLVIYALIFLTMALGVYKFGYNKETEMLLGVDHHAQQQEWKEVLKISGKFRHPNRLVIYYTDLALFQTGQLLDSLFHYPQTGSDGLRLKWEHSPNLIYGSDVFYYLAYNSEAERWAFEAMEAKGANPRVLKRLVSTSIVNGEAEVARKYLNILEHTLFYRGYARHYMLYLNDPVHSFTDPDIERSKSYLVKSDFLSNPYDLNLLNLLKNNPGNRMAYEYLIASLLLDKRLDAFTKVFAGFREYGYNRIPVHVEEALLLYSLEDNRNLLPEGFTISPGTIRRFREYGSRFAANRNNREAAANALKKDFGDTFWYYVQFINNK